MAYNAQLIPASATFFSGGQPVSSPVALPSLQDQASTQVFSTVMLLPSGGTARNFPPPSTWTQRRQFQVVNIDPSGYALLTLDPGPATLTFLLAPLGGQFSYSTAATAGSPDPGNWLIQSCDSLGVVDNGAATLLYVYATGA